jgi:hypothetical protein
MDNRLLSLPSHPIRSEYASHGIGFVRADGAHRGAGVDGVWLYFDDTQRPG